MGTFIALFVLYLLWRGERKALQKARLQDKHAQVEELVPAPNSSIPKIITLARIIIRDNSPW